MRKIWCHSRDGEAFDWIEYSTRKEAIMQGKIAYGGEPFYIGIQGERFKPYVDIDAILEDLQEQAADKFGDLAEYYLDDIRKEYKEELQKRMQAVYEQWAKETDNEPNFYEVRGIEKIE